MSFSGYYEYITKSGRYHAVPVFDEYEVGSEEDPVMYHHLVDTTNGYDQNDPHTCDAPKKEIGFVDVWHEDHYGNKFATKIHLYAPDSEHWQSVLV